MSRAVGKVKWFNKGMGFGFIEQGSGPDLFTQCSAIRGTGFKTVLEGPEVEFSVTQGQKGLLAENITVVS